MHTKADLENILLGLRDLPSEKEWFEFKEANDNFKTNEIGKYFSALSNEANLHKKESGWLIFGINDKTREIEGTLFRKSNEHLNSLKLQIAQNTTNKLSFVHIYELFTNGKRIVMFEIPPAPIGIPIAWKGHYYGREHESLTALNSYKYIILSFLKQKRRAGRDDIDSLLFNQLEETLTQEQKKDKIKNLLYRLSKEQRIKNISGSTKKPIWTLV
jgi:ATP-dependent DNA helicase RecG